MGTATTFVKHRLPLSPKHLADLRASGLSDATILAMQCYTETDNRKVHELLNWNGRSENRTANFYRADYSMHSPAAEALGECLVFPYFDAHGKPLGYCQLKPDNPRHDPKRDGRVQKYEGPIGSPHHLYFTPGSWAWLSNPMIPLWIIEGLKKAMCGWQHLGIAAVGINGMWGWKSKGQGLLPDFDQIDFKGRTVVLAPDSDYEIKGHVKSGAWRLADELRDRGAIVLILRIPHQSDAKTGLDDWIGAEGTDELRGLLESRGLLAPDGANRAIRKRDFSAVSPIGSSDSGESVEFSLTTNQYVYKGKLHAQPLNHYGERTNGEKTAFCDCAISSRVDFGGLRLEEPPFPHVPKEKLNRSEFNTNIPCGRAHRRLMEHKTFKNDAAIGFNCDSFECDGCNGKKVQEWSDHCVDLMEGMRGKPVYVYHGRDLSDREWKRFHRRIEGEYIRIEFVGHKTKPLLGGMQFSLTRKGTLTVISDQPFTGATQTTPAQAVKEIDLAIRQFRSRNSAPNIPDDGSHQKVSTSREWQQEQREEETKYDDQGPVFQEQAKQIVVADGLNVGNDVWEEPPFGIAEGTNFYLQNVDDETKERQRDAIADRKPGWRRRKKGLSKTNLLVLEAVPEGVDCYVSASAVSQKIGLSVRAVQLNLLSLAKQGLVLRVGQGRSACWRKP